MAAGVVPQSSCSLRPITPASICSSQRRRQAGVALAEEAQVHREGIGAPAACARCSRGPACRWWRRCRWPGRCRRRAWWSRRGVSASSICCGQMKWMWLSMPPAVTMLPSPPMISVPGADHDVDAGLHVGIAGLADGDDAAVLQADVGLDDAPVVEDQRVGHHGVERALGARALALAPCRRGWSCRRRTSPPRRSRLRAACSPVRPRSAGRCRPRRTRSPDGGAEHLGVGAPADGGHRELSFLPCTQAAKAVDVAVARRIDQLDRALLAGLEAHRRARRRCSSRMPRARRAVEAAGRRWSPRSGSASRPGSAGRRCLDHLAVMARRRRG